jgi:hypothetical protein
MEPEMPRFHVNNKRRKNMDSETAETVTAALATTGNRKRRSIGEDEVRLAAYFIWEREPHRSQEECWLEAERDLKKTLKKPSKKTGPHGSGAAFMD